MADETARATWKTKLRRFAAFAIVAILAGGGTRLWIWSTQKRPPIPSIAQGLPGNNYDPARREAFTQRLRDRFPIGSPEFDLVRELWLEGFRPANDPRHDSEWHSSKETRSSAIGGWQSNGAPTRMGG